MSGLPFLEPLSELQFFQPSSFAALGYFGHPLTLRVRKQAARPFKLMISRARARMFVWRPTATQRAYDTNVYVVSRTGNPWEAGVIPA